MLRLVTTRTFVGGPAVRIAHRGFASAAGSKVKILGSDSAYKTIIKAGSGRKAVVYFTAKWCPPCKMISPIYDELSKEYDSIDFAKVDVDELNATAAEAGIRSMPTFYYFNDGVLQRGLSFSGADEAMLRENVKQLVDL